MPNPNTALLPPSIGRFQIVRVLGSGGMGLVYEGFDSAVSRYAAVKLLRREMLEHPMVAENFVLEAQRIAKLEAHPNIPTIYEVGVHEGLPFLAMQKIDGDSLHALLQKRGIASIALLRAVASGIGGALAFAHERGVVHCDVKPQNVLVDRAGKPYLTDFGLSRARRDPLGATSPDLLGLTPYYASPEQNQGKPADSRSDVYSLGIVLYEMCAGVSPWVHLSPEQLATTPLRTPAARADQRNKNVPAQLANALARALSSEPQERPTALELARAVLRATDAQARWTIADAVEFDPHGAATLTGPPSRPIQRIVLGASALLAMGAAASIWALSRDSMGQTEPTPAALETPQPPAIAAAPELNPTPADTPDVPTATQDPPSSALTFSNTYLGALGAQPVAPTAPPQSANSDAREEMPRSADVAPTDPLCDAPPDAAAALPRASVPELMRTDAAEPAESAADIAQRIAAEAEQKRKRERGFPWQPWNTGRSPRPGVRIPLISPPTEGPPHALEPSRDESPRGRQGNAQPTPPATPRPQLDPSTAIPNLGGGARRSKR